MRRQKPQVIRYTICFIYEKNLTRLTTSHPKIDVIISLLNALR